MKLKVRFKKNIYFFVQIITLHLMGGRGEVGKSEDAILPVKYKSGSIVVCRCFASGGTGALYKKEGILRPSCRNIEATFQHVRWEVKAQ